jgi:hypothetical protein
MRQLIIFISVGFFLSCVPGKDKVDDVPGISIENARIINISGTTRLDFDIYNRSPERVAIIVNGLSSRIDVVGDTYKLDLNREILDGETTTGIEEDISYLPCIVIINPTSFYHVIQEYENYSDAEKINTNNLRHFIVYFYLVDERIPTYSSYQSYKKYLKEFGRRIELSADFGKWPAPVK